MKKENKVLVLLLIFAICSLSVTAFADEAISFKTPITDTFKKSAKDWFSTVDDRANLTLLLILDLQNYDDSLIDTDSLLTKSTYVGLDEDENVLIVAFQSYQNTVFVMYAPSVGIGAQYLVFEQKSDISTELTLSNACKEYKRTQATDIVAAANRISEIVGN